MNRLFIDFFTSEIAWISGILGFALASIIFFFIQLKKNNKYKKLQQEIFNLRTDLESTVNKDDSRSKKITPRSTAYQSLESIIKEKDKKIDSLYEEIQDLKNHLPPLVEKYKQKELDLQEIQLELNKAQTIIDQLSKDKNSDLNHKTPDINDFKSRDDLQKIRGIGSAIEKILHNHEIFYFLQIAQINEYEIDSIAHNLKGLRSRIYREDWIGQAKSFLVETNDET